MVHFPSSLFRFRWSVIQFAVASLFAVPMPFMAQQPMAATNEFDQCARDLTDLAIDSAVVAQACSEALHPTEVSFCVMDVVEVSGVEPMTALSACSRDRRPAEVATCVANIYADLTVEDAAEVVQLCHLSILPERYSACVVGLSQELGLTTKESLNECISAGYRPVEVAPTFIPVE